MRTRHVGGLGAQADDVAFIFGLEDPSMAHVSGIFFLGEGEAVAFVRTQPNQKCTGGAPAESTLGRFAINVTMIEPK